MFGAFGALAFVGGVVFLGCSNEAEKCERLGTCSPPSSGSGGGGTSTCVPSKNALPVSDSCGIFVSTSLGDDGGDGSKSDPVRTLAKAIDLAVQGGTSVYACAETFAEAVTVPAGMLFFGGLACSTDWRYAAGEKTTVEAPSDGIGLRLAGGGTGTTRVEDVLVKAADATVPGGSSIAGLIEEGVSAEFARCEFEAGNGRDGAKGETPMDPVGPADPTDPAIRGQDGVKACNGTVATGNLGGAGAANALCSTAMGGNGGTGHEGSGEDGTDGQPAGALGLHGVGQPAMGVWNCITGAGQLGDIGADGAPGAGASEAELGSLSATGYAGIAGTSGADAAPGQSGGGGGAAKGKVGCNGASGGGGGAGGCGGKGGAGGQAGGASIALIVLNADIVFTDVKLAASNAGNGGDGGDGQAGGIGGLGGLGGLGDTNAPITAKACAGGDGGPGGVGGKGGGGRGGHSIGLAFTGSQPPVDGVSIITGMPGMGGASAGGVIQAAVGAKASTQAFP